MKRKRRIELTVETEHRLVVRWSRGAARARCAECGGEMASLGGAAVPPHLAASALRGRAGERVHIAEAPDGSVLVCLASLLG